MLLLNLITSPVTFSRTFCEPLFNHVYQFTSFLSHNYFNKLIEMNLKQGKVNKNTTKNKTGNTLPKIIYRHDRILSKNPI